MDNSQNPNQTQEKSTFTTPDARKSKLPTPEVLAMGEINFAGNVIPHTWFQALRLESGNAYLPAIVILSEICYWYRPRYVKDEHTGAVVGIEKKFWGDKLQRSYSSFSTLGLSKQQAYDACHYLQKQGLITLETRTIITEAGRKIPNELFISIDPKAIAKISSPRYVVSSGDDGVSSGDDGVSSGDDGVSSGDDGVSSGDDTNTKITTETTSKITTDNLFGSDAAKAVQKKKKEKTGVDAEITAKVYAVCKLVVADCPVSVRKHVSNTAAWLVKKYPDKTPKALCGALDKFALWFSTVHWKGRAPQPQNIPTLWQQALDYAEPKQSVVKSNQIGGTTNGTAEPAFSSLFPVRRLIG
jgi:hypothetical protein